MGLLLTGLIVAVVVIAVVLWSKNRGPSVAMFTEIDQAVEDIQKRHWGTLARNAMKTKNLILMKTP